MSEHPELRPKIPLLNLQKTNFVHSRRGKIYLFCALVLVLGGGAYLYHKGYRATLNKLFSSSRSSESHSNTEENGDHPAAVASSPSTMPAPTAQTANAPAAPASPTTPQHNPPSAPQAAIPIADTNSTTTVSNVVEIIHNGPSDSKRIALTFDDGPHATVTPKVLEVLRSNQVHATFFVLGNMVKKNPKILAQVAAEGHEIGNHTFGHHKLTTISTNLVQQELSETQALIKNAIGYEPELFRPPYGAYRSWTKTIMLDNHLKTMVLWSIDTEDWKVRDSERIFNMATNKLQNGSIILCHDIYNSTLNTLPRLIQELKGQGYEFVTISQLCSLGSTNFIRPVVYNTPPPQPVQTPASNPVNPGNPGSPAAAPAAGVAPSPQAAQVVVITNVVVVTNSVAAPH